MNTNQWIQLLIIVLLPTFVISHAILQYKADKATHKIFKRLLDDMNKLYLELEKTTIRIKALEKKVNTP